jgi:hypothetical protein
LESLILEAVPTGGGAQTGEKTACLERQEPAGIPVDFKRSWRGPGGKSAAWMRAAAGWYGFLKSYEIFSRLSSSAV